MTCHKAYIIWWHQIDQQNVVDNNEMMLVSNAAMFYNIKVMFYNNKIMLVSNRTMLYNNETKKVYNKRLLCNNAAKQVSNQILLYNNEPQTCCGTHNTAQYRLRTNNAEIAIARNVSNLRLAFLEMLRSSELKRRFQASRMQWVKHLLMRKCRLFRNNFITPFC